MTTDEVVLAADIRFWNQKLTKYSDEEIIGLFYNEYANNWRFPTLVRNDREIILEWCSENKPEIINKLKLVLTFT